MITNHSEESTEALVASINADPERAGRQAAALLARRPVDVNAARRACRAWRRIGAQRAAAGDAAGADAAFALYLGFAPFDANLAAAAAALRENRLADAETGLRAHLEHEPTDIAALRMLGELAARLGRLPDAARLIERCLELAPSWAAARHQYAMLLHRQNQPARALREIESLRRMHPEPPAYRNLHAVILVRIGELERALALFAGLVESHPDEPEIWLSYGHALATAGRDAQAVTAYRRAAALTPQLGESHWSLANLKTFRFEAADVERMRVALSRADGADRVHLNFALGKAYEDAGLFDASFRHYAAGNRLHRDTLRYSAAEISAHVARCRSLLDAGFFAARRGFGAAASDPIFIVGLPRSGSTLIEQILSSHSAVEGTAELPDLLSIARRIAGNRRLGTDGSKYPEALAELDAGECRALGEEYLARTRVQRRTDRPLFIDKMPNNFLHIGLIRLILPNARIIDARRHPMACCFSAYKQLFANGQRYTYDLGELGSYYRDYVDLLRHFDAVLPGAVHRVIHERLVEDFEPEVRRLLAHCGLPFEPACLEFHRNVRAVRTASAQQVRRPVSRDGLARWRHFQDKLGPLTAALGDALENYA